MSWSTDGRIGTNVSCSVSSLTETYGYYDPATGRTLMPSDGSKLVYEDVIVFIVGGGNYSEYQHLQVYAKSQSPARTILYGSTDILAAKQVGAGFGCDVVHSGASGFLFRVNSIDCVCLRRDSTDSLAGQYESTMLSRLTVSSVWRVYSPLLPSLSRLAGLPSFLPQQRSFGVFSSIRDNVNAKMKEKQQKTAGWKWRRFFTHR